MQTILFRFILLFLLGVSTVTYGYPGPPTAVGRIPGTFSVNQAGASTYTVPIEFPAGVNNMQPAISAVYNSQAGKGLVGWGWSLSGLSSIMRTQKTVYYDGVEKDISWNNQDSLVLDGQRMILVKRLSTYHEYRLESDPTIRVYGYDIQSWGPSYFKAFSKSGLTMTYGNPQTETSYILMYGDAANGTDPVKAGWNLIEVEDANGNFMKIDYYHSDLGYKGNVINKIIYGGNKRAGTTGDISVFFKYAKRPDDILNYIAGKESLQQLRLTQINTVVGTTQEKEYRFSYQSGNISRLSSIDFYEGYNKIYDPLEFSYGGGNTAESDIDISFITADASGGQKDKKALVAVDLDGDGYNELGDIYYKDESLSEYFGLYRNYFEIHRKSNDWGRNLPREYEYFPVAFAMGIGDRVLQSSVQELFADFNGNGSAESTFFYFSGTNLNIRVTDRSNENILRDESLNSTRNTPFIATGNYQGNPLANALIIYNDPHSYSGGGYSYRYDLIESYIEGQVKAFVGELHLIVPRKIEYAMTVNLGSASYRDDIWLVLDDGKVWIIKNDQGTTYFNGVIPTYTGLEIGKKSLYKFGDLNGDGLVDVVYRKNHNDWFIGYNRGDGTFTSKAVSINCPTSLLLNGVAIALQDDIILTDINNDGLVDIIVGDERDSYPTYWRFYLNGGNGTFSLWRTVESPEKAAYSCFADLLGKGSVNWAHATNDGKVVITDFGFDVKQNLLTKVSNPVSPPLQFTYKPMAECKFRDGLQDEINSCHTYKDYLRIGYFPFKSTRMPVVSEIIEGRSHITYDYGTALNNWKHRGYVGFRFQQESNLTKKLKIETRNKIYHSTDGKHNVMLPNRIFHYQGGRPVHNAYEEHSHTVRAFFGKRFALQQHRYVYSNDVSHRVYQEYYTYDTYNNLTKYTKNSDRYTLRKSSEYAIKGAWCPNVLSKETITERIDADSLTKIHLYGYDGYGNLTSQNTDYGTTGALVINYESINVYGRPGQIRRTANSQSRISTFTYSEDGRFIVGETNELGETITRTWGYASKKLESETTRLGTTSYTYDSYGNLKTTKYPNGRTETRQTLWALGSSVIPWYLTANCKYYTTITTQGESPVTVYYNTYGQEIGRKVTGFNSRTSYSFKTYLPDGKLYQVSKPTFGSSPTDTDWAETYLYDNYGRTKEITGIRGNTYILYDLDADYDGYPCLITITSTPEGITEAYHDASGFLRQSVVNGKKVHFKYTVGKKIKSAHPEGYPAVTFQYNRNGNRTQINDPNTSTVYSEYNAWGDLVKESQQVHNSSAGFITNTYTYLSNGLLSQRSRNGAITTYEYDTHKRLVRISNNESQKTFTYGNYDRVTQIQTTINGRTLTTQKEYNAYGKVTKHTYPYGYYINNTYDIYGNLISVTDNASRQIWQLLSCDAEGRVLTEKKGGVTTTFRYTQKGEPDSIAAPGIVDMRYTYYPTGNVKSYKDAVCNQAENYTYDALDRLTSWKKATSSYPYNNMEYDSNNLITSKYDYFSPDGLQYYTYNMRSVATRLYSETTCTQPEQTITYTDFKKVKTILEGDHIYTFGYGPDDERLFMKRANPRGSFSERYYAENFEEDAIDYHSKRHYVYGGNGLAGIYTNRGFYNTYTDLLGSLTVLSQGSTVVERYAYDPWGSRRNPQNWQQKATLSSPISYRGYTMHEHLDEIGLINMNARLYDPHTCQFLSPDPMLQSPENWLNYNRYSYCLNNPLKYTDPSGELAWYVIPAIAAATFATTNLVAHAIRGDVNSIGDGFKYFAQGALAGFGWGCAYQFAPGIPIIGKGLQDLMTAYVYSQVAIGALGVVGGGVSEGWNGVVNGMKIFYGNFYLDENDFWGGVIQGLSRHTWELPQTFVGHTVSQVRNVAGFVDRVDYLGGATFATNEDANKEVGDGISFGNFININLRGKITGDFDEYVISNPLYMHEYGHTIDSRIFGLSYLFAVGVPSLFSASSSSRITGNNPDKLKTHDVYWTETRANKWAAKYFGKHYNINWDFPTYPQHYNK